MDCGIEGRRSLCWKVCGDSKMQGLASYLERLIRVFEVAV